MGESMLAAVQRENRRLQEEIQRVMMHNTKLQRELMTLNASREHIVADGHARVAQLTEELREVDAELRTVRGDCDRIIAVICEAKQSSIMRSLGDVSADLIEEDDLQSDHSTASTASTSSFRSTRSASRAAGGRPPLSKKMSIDIDAERVPAFNKAPLHAARPSSSSVSSSAPSAQAAARETIMSRISRSVKKAQSMPAHSSSTASSPADRPSVQLSLNGQLHSPMLAYKANAVLRATQTHLNNFRRHSGPHRRNRDTVVL